MRFALAESLKFIRWVTLQELITTAEAGTHMYFLVSGTLVYSRDDDELLGT